MMGSVRLIEASNEEARISLGGGKTELIGCGRLTELQGFWRIVCQEAILFVH